MVSDQASAKVKSAHYNCCLVKRMENRTKPLFKKYWTYGRKKKKSTQTKYCCNVTSITTICCYKMMSLWYRTWYLCAWWMHDEDKLVRGMLWRTDLLPYRFPMTGVWSHQVGPQRCICYLPYQNLLKSCFYHLIFKLIWPSGLCYDLV